MKKEDVKRLAELRNYIIGYYNTLDGKGTPSALVKCDEVAYFCESIIKSADDILRPYVNFKNNE